MFYHKLFKYSTSKLKEEENRKRILFILKLLLLLGLLFFQDNLPTSDSYFGRIFEVTVLYITAHLVVSFARLAIVSLYIRKNHMRQDSKDNFIIGINRIASMLSFFAFVICAFLFFKIDVKDLFTSISIVAAAIALISKDYVANMINGMIIMFSNQLSLNDYIKVGDHRGKIVDITLINIHLVNDDEDLIFVPNTVVLSSNVVNYTKRRIKKITIDFELHENKLDELARLEDHLKRGVMEYQGYIKRESYNLKVVQIAKDAITLKFQFVLLKHNKEIEREIRKKIFHLIVNFIHDQENIKV
ncbi:MAG: mechanosensitive ion channel family protein [Bacteroidota bacterium]|nr:mechanosensitive ion channel family protein [Bacteroidota bacterium]